MRGVQWPRVQLIDSENAQLKMLSSSVSGFILASVVFKQRIAKDLTSRAYAFQDGILLLMLGSYLK